MKYKAKTHAHAKTIEACKKRSNGSRKKNIPAGGRGKTERGLRSKSKSCICQRTRNRTHTRKKERKEIHVMGNGNQKLLQCLLLFLLPSLPVAALHIIYDPKGKKRATAKCSKSCLCSTDGRLKLFRWKMNKARQNTTTATTTAEQRPMQVIWKRGKNKCVSRYVYLRSWSGAAHAGVKCEWTSSK